MIATARAIRWGSYLVRYYARTRLGSREPLLGGIKLSHRCNLSCLHCPFWQREGPSLAYLQVRSVLTTLHSWGVRILIIEGGEPLLWRDGEYDINAVIALAKELFFGVAVTTNGTLPIDNSADTVWVSVDGLKETHDRIRGETFERIMGNIAASPHPRIFAHTTINSLNWAEIPELVRYLADRVKAITVQFHYPYGDLDRELFLPFDKRCWVLDRLIELKRQGFPLGNSYACLRALKASRWTCRPWMVASVDPNGKLTHDCYVRDRGEISCERCGFSAHTEISLAYGGNMGAVSAGYRLLLSHGA